MNKSCWGGVGVLGKKLGFWGVVFGVLRWHFGVAA